MIISTIKVSIVVLLLGIIFFPAKVSAATPSTALCCPVGFGEGSYCGFFPGERGINTNAQCCKGIWPLKIEVADKVACSGSQQGNTTGNTQSATSAQPAGGNQPALPAPEIISPVDGQTLDLEGDYTFYIKPIQGATLYWLKLSQDGEILYSIARRPSELKMGENGNYLLEVKANELSRQFSENIIVKTSIQVLVGNQWSEPREININLKSKFNQAAPEFADLVNGSTLGLEGIYMFKIKPVSGATEYKLELYQDGKLIYIVSVNVDKFSPQYTFAVSGDDPEYKIFHAGEIRASIQAFVGSQWSKPNVITIKLESNKPARELKFSSEEVKDRQKEITANLSKEVCAQQIDQSKKACQVAVAACIEKTITEEVLRSSENFSRSRKACGEEGVKAAGQGVGGDGQGKTQAEVFTFTDAAIHGSEGGSIPLDADETWVSVGSRTWFGKKENGNCASGTVNLTLTKIFDDKGKTVAENIPISKTPVQVGNMLGTPDSSSPHRTCWSYQAKLPKGINKAGVYQLDAKYEGNGPYKASESSVKVTFTTKEGKIETVTKVKLKGLLATTKLLKSLAQVAGVAVQADGERVKIVNDPNSSRETVTLVPESSIKGSSCDAQRLPIIHFAVTKILSSGVVETVYDNPQYPNCEPWVMNVSQLGDLSQINRIEAVASLLDDPQSQFQASQGLIVIKVGDNVVPAKPFVKLSSNPSDVNIAAGDSVTIVATTNFVLDEPVFELNHNGQVSSVPATLSSNNCQNNQGNCEYLLEIPMVDGEYTIKFASGKAADTLSFSTESNIEEEISSVGLLVGGTEVPLGLDGGMIDLTLDGSPTNTFFLVKHLANGGVKREPVIIQYENLTASSTPAATSMPTPNKVTGNYYWYCENSNIVEIDPLGNKREHTRCSDFGQQCRPINTPGYKSDAECYTPQGSAQAPVSECRWKKLEGASGSECNWDTHQVYDVYQNTCTGEYDRRNYQYKKGECGYTGQQSDSAPEPQTSQPNNQTSGEGAAGQPCIYSEADGKCFNGTIKSQSTCGGKTSSTNVCINPSGGCEYGGSQVDCITGEAI